MPVSMRRKGGKKKEGGKKACQASSIEIWLCKKEERKEGKGEI